MPDSFDPAWKITFDQSETLNRKQSPHATLTLPDMPIRIWRTGTGLKDANS